MTNTTLNAKGFGLAGGIIGAVITFLTTIVGVYGFSKTAEFMATTLWANYGYSVSWLGALVGAVIGFVYGFIIMWAFALIYNKFIS